MITNEMMQRVEEIKSDILLYAGDWVDDRSKIECQIEAEEGEELAEFSFELWGRDIALTFPLYTDDVVIFYGGPEMDVDWSAKFSEAMFWRTVAMEMCDE